MVKCPLGDIQEVLSLKMQSFDPPTPPAPPPKVGSFWLELTLSPSISILVKFREKKLITSTSIFELNVSFTKPQWNIYKMDTICAWQKCPLYGDVRFIKSPSKNQKSSKVNMKSDCLSWLSKSRFIGRTERRNKSFFILKSSNKVHYISPLNYWSWTKYTFSITNE